MSNSGPTIIKLIVSVVQQNRFLDFVLFNKFVHAGCEIKQALQIYRDNSIDFQCTKIGTPLGLAGNKNMESLNSLLVERIIKITHRQLAIDNSYEKFVSNLEYILRRLPPDYEDHVLEDPDTVKENLAALAGNTGLVIFGV